eukprot:2691205-Pleurochrysis_carterae.AAC.3
MPNANDTVYVLMLLLALGSVHGSSALPSYHSLHVISLVSAVVTSSAHQLSARAGTGSGYLTTAWPADGFKRHT